MKLYSYDSSFEETLGEIKSHYKECSFTAAVNPMMNGRNWQYIGELQGILTDEAYQDLKIKTILKIIFSFGLALCLESIRQDLQTISSSNHREIKPIYIAVRPDPEEIINRVQKLFNAKMEPISQSPLDNFAKTTNKISKEELLKKDFFSLDEFSEFNDDEDVVRKAVQRNIFQFEEASDKLKDKKNFVLKLLDLRSGCEHIIQFVSPRLKDDDQVAEKAMNISAGIYPYLGPNQKKKINFATAYVEYSPLGAFVHMPEELKKNKDLAKLGFMKNPSCYMHFDADLKKDQPFFLDILKTCNDQHTCISMYEALCHILGENKVREEFRDKGITIKNDGTFFVET